LGLIETLKLFRKVILQDAVFLKELNEFKDLDALNLPVFKTESFKEFSIALRQESSSFQMAPSKLLEKVSNFFIICILYLPNSISLSQLLKNRWIASMSFCNKKRQQLEISRY
jgi:hypothetical protein